MMKFQYPGDFSSVWTWIYYMTEFSDQESILEYMEDVPEVVGLSDNLRVQPHRLSSHFVDTVEPEETQNMVGF